MRDSTRWTATAALAAAGLALAAWPGALAGPRGQAGSTAAPAGAEERLAAGKLSYRVYCASCHGEAGRGNGPVAHYLRILPTDLTRLAASHGGSFPAEEVAAAIDGRQGIGVHGPREMPVWGLTFALRDRDAAREAEVREQIRDLVRYLESIQEPKPQR
jgi:cytochrome c1